MSDCPDLKVRVYTDARGTETVAGPMVDDQSDAIVIYFCASNVDDHTARCSSRGCQIVVVCRRGVDGFIIVSA